MSIKLKKSMRKMASLKRSSVHELNGKNLADSICNLLIDWLKTRGSEITMAAYIPIRSEVDLLPATRILSRSGIRICLPEVVAYNEPLQFRLWDTLSELIEGKYGIPVVRNGMLVRPDLILCPLLSYDKFGNRLGYGGGFYDRTLRKLKLEGKVFALGCCYGAQKYYEALPVEPHDFPLDGVLTEDGFELFNKVDLVAFGNSLQG